jgi:hypothetical protein
MRESITTNDSRDPNRPRPASLKLRFSEKKIHSVQRTIVDDGQFHLDPQHNGNHLHPRVYIGHIGTPIAPFQSQQRQLPHPAH